MAIKVTFTLDEATIRKLEVTAQRLRKPKSQIVRDAVQAFQGVPDKLSDHERRTMLKALRRLAAQPPSRSQREVDEELEEIRAVRRLPGRLHPAE